MNVRAAGNYKHFTLHPAFIALVYPAAMREVHTPGDLVEQLDSRHEPATNRAFLAAATTLYVDPQTLQPKRGGGGKSPGTARRLADFCNQIDVMWDLYALQPGELLVKLPKEFHGFSRWRDVTRAGHF